MSDAIDPSSILKLCRKMGHDLRQPLHGLGMLTTALSEQLMGSEQEAILKHMAAALLSMEETINQCAEQVKIQEQHLENLTSNAVSTHDLWLIGDEPHLINALEMEITLAGVKVRHLGSVEAAIDALSLAAPDTVISICDTSTAKSELCFLLALKQRHPACKTAIISGGTLRRSFVTSAQWGGIELMQKPIDSTKLMAFLNIRHLDILAESLDFLHDPLND